MTLPNALAHCDTALNLCGDVRDELATATRAVPVELENLRRFLAVTLDALEVVESRLHTASNHIRRAA